MRASKTPDCRVFKQGQFAFYLEVKEIAASHWVRGARPDPIFNRLTDDIHKAVQQFEAVNANRAVPNVLALVNNDPACGSLDLIGVITGHLLLEDGETAPIYKNYSEGRIRSDKFKVDAYLWFDSRNANQIFLNMADRRHLARVGELFGLDPNSVPTIGA